MYYRTETGNCLSAGDSAPRMTPLHSRHSRGNRVRLCPHQPQNGYMSQGATIPSGSLT